MARRISRLSRHRMQLNADMSANMTERFNVSGALLVKLFGRPGRRVAGSSPGRAGRVRDSGIRLALLSRYLFASLSLVGAVGTAAVYWLGGREAVQGALGVGTVVALAAYVTRLYSPLTDLASAQVDVLGAIVSFDRVFEVLDTPPSVADRPDAQPLPVPVEGRVEANGVWFRYPAASEVSVASLEATAETVERPARDRAGGLGPAGCVVRGRARDDDRPGRAVGSGQDHPVRAWCPGCTTRWRASLTIDGHDVRDVTLASVAGAVGVVTQDAHLFHDTIAANLRYARPAATDAELVAACRAARIHDLIVSLPDGYDTVVGERGYRLSGGEKQRLAIARVLLKDPAVVILDEATAHLDSETELLVQQALAEALRGRTSIVIAHRLSTIQAADQILVLDDGQIVARGTHASLIGRGRAVRRPLPDPVPAGRRGGGRRQIAATPRRRAQGAGAVGVALGGLQPAAQAGGVGMDAVEGLELGPVLRVDAVELGGEGVIEGGGDVLARPARPSRPPRPSGAGSPPPPRACRGGRAAGRSGRGPPRPGRGPGTCAAT